MVTQGYETTGTTPGKHWASDRPGTGGAVGMGTLHALPSGRTPGWRGRPGDRCAGGHRQLGLRPWKGQRRRHELHLHGLSLARGRPA